MKKIKALYIHGLNSYPIPQKIKMLEDAGFDVFAPDVDYRNEKDIYQWLKQEIADQNIEFLVGSSLGGFTAFWLGEDLGLPCLLFNPAMSYNDELQEHIPEIETGNCPARFVVIGAHDDVIDPQENLRFFRGIDYGECHQRVIVCEWLGHQIDFPSFEELVAWAFAGYKVFLKDEYGNP
jgi:uncharacterized protein